jgi:hypothetical protein
LVLRLPWQVVGDNIAFSPLPNTISRCVNHYQNILIILIIEAPMLPSVNAKIKRLESQTTLETLNFLFRLTLIFMLIFAAHRFFGIDPWGLMENIFTVKS